MTDTLPVSRLVAADVNLSPAAASFRNLNSLLILGDSDIIDVDERIRSYSSIDDVAVDFETTSEEYKAATIYFSQVPRPTQLYIGRWAYAATSGLIKGGVLTTAEQVITLWTAVTAGSFTISIDGTEYDLTGLDFSSETNLNGVASVITTGLTGATCTWDGEKFQVTSSTTGATSTVSYATAVGSGTDISEMLKLTSTLASPPVDGIAAETALEAVTELQDVSTDWYALSFASDNITDDDHMEVAAYIEAASPSHVYGVGTTNTSVLSSTVDTDIASKLKAAGYNRSFDQYSSSNVYAVCSALGRILTTDFTANNSTITLMYKDEPGITAESLRTSQADVLDDKNCNYFANYNNDTAILQNGIMASGDVFFDTIYGLDWLSNAIQTNVFNLLYTSTTKIPQTDAGNQQIASVIEATCEAAVNNGLVAPGYWNSGGFGTLETGDYLDKGYYVYAPPISDQAAADREARKSVSFQVAVKLAGAIHTVDIAINVNR